MSSLWTKLKTAQLLGLNNVLRVAAYRAAIRTELHPVCRVRTSLPAGPFFKKSGIDSTYKHHPGQIRTPRLFGWLDFPLSSPPPDWHRNVLSGKSSSSENIDWWRIPDFDPSVGDIKGIWEASRFDWALTFAQRAILGDATAIDQLNEWIADWCKKNSAYKGVNWKCGQEASIRVMHLAMTALMLNPSPRPLPGLLQLIEAHLKRIAPTVSYAIAQDNNHGTSEGAALFIGGTWLVRQGVGDGDSWARSGRRILENRVRHLIAADGSFSQYSLNYHRVLLDTLAMVEIWRRALMEARFSDAFYDRAGAATDWLYEMINLQSGSGRIMGANDGAWLMPLAATDSQDFRPSAQVASALFRNRKGFTENGEWNAPLSWLRLPSAGQSAVPTGSKLFDDGGYAVLRNQSAFAMMRYPRFKFRPGHADALHVDLWIDGVNCLRDGGSYSYNTEQRWLDYFAGTEGHNTIQFDEHDQMPRLGRFLFGDWLEPKQIEPITETEGQVSFAAGYRDSRGAAHLRRVSLGPRTLEVDDKISGRFKMAVLRWRLTPGNWLLDGHRVYLGSDSLRIESTAPIQRIGLVEGWESRYYGRKSHVPVLEVQVGQAGLLKSFYSSPA